MIGADEIFEVDVLLATFNGAQYLEEFLNSLKLQRGVKIHLIVGDDGSQDDTLNIIRKHEESFFKLTVILGPHRGPAANFLNLLNYSQFPYAAFADQDDVWHSHHLIDAISTISQEGHVPQMFFSCVLEFGVKLNNYRIWPPLKSAPTIQDFFFQNYARGCTIVMNKSLVQLSRIDVDVDRIVMHDWWIALIAYSCGQVFFSRDPHIMYRLHANNTIGNKRQKRSITIKRILMGEWKPHSQLSYLSELFSSASNPMANSAVLEVLQLFDLPFRRRVHFIVNKKIRFRHNYFDECKLRMLMLIYPIFLKKNQNVKLRLN